MNLITYIEPVEYYRKCIKANKESQLSVCYHGRFLVGDSETCFEQL